MNDRASSEFFLREIDEVLGESLRKECGLPKRNPLRSSAILIISLWASILATPCTSRYWANVSSSASAGRLLDRHESFTTYSHDLEPASFAR